ncbi:MAG: VWA domain-containing protein [Pirellula sp.]|nr:VWA domain-containing protein [Pirellula sp.]
MHLVDSMSPWFLAQEDSRVFYQWMRVEQMDQWLHWFGLGCILLLIGSYVVFWYRRDWKELPKGIGWSLLALRLFAILGILVFFFDLQKRTEKQITRSSKLAVLVDTSLSMTMPQQEREGASEIIDPSASRIAAVQKLFKETPILKQFQEKHDIAVYRFDQSTRPTAIANFQKPRPTDPGNTDNRIAIWESARMVAWSGTLLLGASIAVLLGALVLRVRGNTNVAIPYVLMGALIGLISGFVLISTSILRADGIAWQSLWSSQPPQLAETDAKPDGSAAEKSADPSSENEAKPTSPEMIVWETALAATGTESRIGDAIHAVLEQERGAPLAAIVLLTDGRSNAGLDPLTTVAEAAVQGIPIHTIGLGTDKNPVNVRVLDVESPKRVFPGDRFRLNALVQASGLEGKQVSLQLRRRAGGQQTSTMTIDEERTVTLAGDDTITSVVFDIMPREVGPWIYEVKAIPASQDTNPLDNAMEREVRVVEPKATVLIIAGGPTREYQFVRNLLYRDPTMQSHVYLQTGKPGVSQESQKLLTEFPRTRAEMSQYDCVIAFDAAWMDLDKEQIDVLEKWVSEQAGGLAIIAGPVATPKWAGAAGNGNPKAEVIRNLAPVVLDSRGARMVSIGRFESETAWPLQLTNDAIQSDFMQIGKTMDASKKAWADFSGVFSYYACYEPKPGATPIANFADPETSVNGTLPIYLATQFYGAGRVSFQGSGEFWRLRDLGEEYFDTYYTKLVRWAAQGRLLRDSDRGILLLDKEQAIVGEQVMVRAVLRDAQFQPLVIPEANAKLIDPSGRSTPLPLTPIPDPSQPGVYIGQFFVKATGNYEVQLPVGGLAEQVLLTQQITVRVPAVEIQRPQRNDPVLTELASRTGGKYWIGVDGLSGVGEATDKSLVESIETRDQTNFLPGTPDRDFQQRWMGVLMAWIVGCLSLEWLIRRMSKLA